MQLYFVLLLLVIAIQADITDEQKARLKEYVGACVTSSAVKPELVADSKKGKFAKDNNLNEFLFCLAKKVGFLNDAGEFQKDVIRAEVAAGHSASDADDVVAACTTKQATPQLTSLEFAKCLYEQSKDHYSLA